MKVISYMVPVAMLLLSFLYNNNPFTLPDEAQKAFHLINDIRGNPAKYSQELKLSGQLLTSQTTFNWNDTLAKAAEAKAMDMAKRNYFSHLTPEGHGITHFLPNNDSTVNGERKFDNVSYFEFIDSGSDSGVDAIRSIIINANTANNPNKFHRYHLPDIGKGDASLYDIGIGFVKNDGSDYRSYTCIIIAKHKW